MFDDARHPGTAAFSLRSLLHWIAAAMTVLATGCDRQPTAEESAADKRALELTKSYTDPKGRFTCKFPTGWHVDDKREDNRSNVRFFASPDEIRVIARATDRHTLDDSDRKEMQTALENILAQVRKRGGTGRLIEVTASQRADAPALVAELEIDRPEFMWVRQVKFKGSGCDHTLGLYVKSQEKRESLAAAFEAFAANYRTVGATSSLGQ